jgi:epoxide hydrolase
MRSIRPFQIRVSDYELGELRERLNRTRWPERECVSDWSQGFPLAYARDLAQYWSSGYDWRARESALNRFEHFTTEIDGLDVHFIHRRSPHPGAFPLILTHGWPSSFTEFDKVIEPLTAPTAHGADAQDAFDVVCPSLPGFAFSGKPSRTGWGVQRIARAWDELMGRLGYQRYGAQGGDWGAAVTTAIGHQSLRCAAIHMNTPMSSPISAGASVAEEQARASLEHYRRWGAGYSRLQSTRPQTVGYALTDSPVGQLAWIVEKFCEWSDCDGHPETVFSRDELLDNVMLYWVTQSAASSARMYWERALQPYRPSRVEIPTGVAAFPRDVLRPPRQWCEGLYNITRWTEMPRGGHFAAAEEPALFVEDIRAFFATVR